MIKRDELIAKIEDLIGNDLITRARLQDIYSNGVQIYGETEVKKITLGVSMTNNFLSESVASGSQFCLTHHGLDLTAHNLVGARIHSGLQRDLQYIFENNLTISGYHYSLDVQPDFGNNATIVKELGAKITTESYYDDWGFVAEFDNSISATVLATRLAQITAHDVFTVYGGPKMVKRIGVCSGGAKPYARTLFEIIDKKIDAHISGEIVEPGIAQAEGVGYNYYACGHYATEVFGVQELGKRLKSYYGNKLAVEFIDIPNPL